MSHWTNAKQPSVPLGTYGPPLLRRRLALPLPQAKTHWHVVGKTGSGKSRFLASLYLSLIKAGASASLIDPHGDLADLVLRYLVATKAFASDEGFRRILYLDLAGAEQDGRYLPFNVLKQPHLRDDAVAANVKEVFHRAWPELATGAATFDTLLPDAVLLLLHNDLPLTAMHRLLIDDDFRSRLLAREADQDLVASFVHFYNRLRKPDQVAYAGSVLRRARQLTQVDVLRYGLGQSDLVLDWRYIIDRGQNTIINLGGLNRDARRLLGCFLTVGAVQGAESRALIAPSERLGDHFLCLDEFQLFTAQGEEALTDMLSQTRKVGLHLVLAHQGWSQASTRLRGALGNVGVRVAFQLDRDDATLSARTMGRVDPKTIRQSLADDTSESVGMAESWERWTQAIEDLRQAQAFIKLPTSAVVKVDSVPVPDPDVDAAQLQRVKDYYLATYFRPRAACARPADADTPPPTVPGHQLGRVELVD